MPDQPTVERRQLLGLRALVDEMLAEIRADASRAQWTPEERARAEADLERIMRQVCEATFAPKEASAANPERD